MKKITAFILSLCLCLGLCACGGEKITGTKYVCTLANFTDDDYERFTVAESVRDKVFNSYVIISEDRTKMVYRNEIGEYIADLVTEYDGKMWYESEVTWQETPQPYGDHKITATMLLFDEARGLVRMNFAFDGEKEGYFGDSKYYLFNEFELE